MKQVLSVIAFLLLTSLLATGAKAVPVVTNTPDYQWFQFGDKGTVIVRAIFKKTGQDCSSTSIETTDKNGVNASIPLKPRITLARGIKKSPPDDCRWRCNRAGPFY